MRIKLPCFQKTTVSYSGDYSKLLCILCNYDHQRKREDSLIGRAVGKNWISSSSLHLCKHLNIELSKSNYKAQDLSRKNILSFVQKFKTSYQTSSSSLLSQVVSSLHILPCCSRQLLQITETNFFWLPHISRFTYYLYNLSRYLRVHSLLISNERKTQTLKQSRRRHRRKDGLYIPEPIGTFT